MLKRKIEIGSAAAVALTLMLAAPRVAHAEENEEAAPTSWLVHTPSPLDLSLPVTALVRAGSTQSPIALLPTRSPTEIKLSRGGIIAIVIGGIAAVVLGVVVVTHGFKPAH